MTWGYSKISELSLGILRLPSIILHCNKESEKNQVIFSVNEEIAFSKI